MPADSSDVFENVSIMWGIVSEDILIVYMESKEGWGNDKGMAYR